MDIHDFMRRWGNVPLVRSEDGKLGLWNGVVGSPIMADLELVSPGELPRVARGVPSFSREVNLDQHNVYNSDIKWEIDPKDILLTVDRQYRRPLKKLSWNPKTGETLLVEYNHADVRGKAPFDDYVRVVILRSQMTCTFRPWFPSWANAVTMDQAEIFDLSYSAQEACEKALRAQGSTGWKFQYNVNNATLQDITGIHQW